MAAAIVFAVLSALSNACSAVLQRLAVTSRVSATRPGWRTAIDLVRQPVWLLGALFLVGTFGFQALALYFGPLSVVQPVLVLELIFTLGLRVFLLHDDIASRTWSAALTICLGLGAFLVIASPVSGQHVPDAGQWILAVGVRAAAVAVLLLLGRYGSPARRAALFGAATAVVWSVDAAFVKQTVDVLAHTGPLGLLTSWPLYAMIATGVLGTALLQGAYAAGPLAASQATLLIVDPLVSISLGIELFGDQLATNPGLVLGAAASLAVLAAGVIMLSIWAPPVMTADKLDQLHQVHRPKELTDAGSLV
jgi:drug/metabolite transporter (DMT)-like permease